MNADVQTDGSPGGKMKSPRLGSLSRINGFYGRLIRRAVAGYLPLADLKTWAYCVEIASRLQVAVDTQPPPIEGELRNYQLDEEIEAEQRFNQQYSKVKQ